MSKPALTHWRQRQDFMDKITDISTLEALYGDPGKASIIKVADHVTPLYAKWIAA